VSLDQEYETPILEVVDKVAEFFEEKGLNATVDYGDKSLTRQDNQGADGRVVFALAGGTYAGPRKMGSVGKTEVQRRAYTLDADVECHIWAWDRSKPADPRAQERAWTRLHEYTLAAIRSYQQGRFKPVRLVPIRVPVEIRFGVARTVLLTKELPVNAVPDDEPKLEATAEVTIKTSQPQGEDAEGDQIPPVESDVADFTVEGD